MPLVAFSYNFNTKSKLLSDEIDIDQYIGLSAVLQHSLYVMNKVFIVMSQIEKRSIAPK